MGYTSESIYQVYFPDSQQIETVRDLKFDESYNYKEIGTIAVEELFFSFLKLESFTNSTYNTPVREKEELPAVPATPPDTYPKVKNDNSDRLSSTSLDNNIPPFWRSSKIHHEPTRYVLVAQHIAFFSVAQSKIRNLFSYNEGIWSPEAHLRKQAIDKEVSSLYKNYIWDLIDLPANTPILRKKWVYKLKYNIDRMISRYKARWVAKSFQ